MNVNATFSARFRKIFHCRVNAAAHLTVRQCFTADPDDVNAQPLHPTPNPNTKHYQ